MAKGTDAWLAPLKARWAAERLIRDLEKDGAFLWAGDGEDGGEVHVFVRTPELKERCDEAMEAADRGILHEVLTQRAKMDRVAEAKRLLRVFHAMDARWSIRKEDGKLLMKLRQEVWDEPSFLDHAAGYHQELRDLLVDYQRKQLDSQAGQDLH